MNPTATFTIRFAQPIVGSGERRAGGRIRTIVLPARGSRQISLGLARAGGTFVPDEPLPLATTFRFVLREGLTDAAGAKVTGELEATFETPPFALKGWHAATYLYAESVTALPAINLLFNADVDATTAAPALSFTNKEGKRIAARVIKADPIRVASQRFPLYRSAGSIAAHVEKIAFLKRSLQGPSARPATRDGGNQLFVTPVQPLPVGEEWKLELAAGLPSTEPGLSLLEPAAIAIGTVKPFIVSSTAAENNGQNGRQLIVRFSKALAAEIKAETIQQWVRISPAPASLKAEIDGSIVTFSGSFKLETDYQLTVAAGLAAREPFTLAEPFTETLAFEPIPPSLALEGFSTHQLSSGTRHFLMKAINVPKIRVTAKLFQPDTAPAALKAYDEYLFPTDAKPDEWHRRVAVEKLPGKAIYSRVISGTDAVDTERTIKLAWSEILGPGRTGVVLVTAEQVGKEQRPGVQAIVQVTDLGVVWKSSAAETFVHVFSLATGTPVPGARLTLLTAENLKIAELSTDATGTAVLPTAEKARWLRTEKGTDLHLVSLDDGSNRLSLYRFRIPYVDEEDGEVENSDAGAQVLLFTERDVYRPGETVHLKGIIRDPRSGKARIPAGLKVKLKATDQREREILSRELTLKSSALWMRTFRCQKGRSAPTASR